VSPVAPSKSVANVQPSLNMSGCTTDTPIWLSRPFNVRKIIVRFAQGQAWLTKRWYRPLSAAKPPSPLGPGAPSGVTQLRNVRVLTLERAAGGFRIVPLVAPNAVDQQAHVFILDAVLRQS
jgi:hypothetical protein